MRKIKTIKENPPALSHVVIEAAIPKLSERLNDLPVELVYLFGSQGRFLQGSGSTTGFSDVDLGVLLSNPGEAVYFKIISELLDVFALLFGREDIDLTILNEAPAVIRAKVAGEGYLLYQKDPRARIDFEVRARREYLDMERMRQFHTNQFLLRLKGGSVGGHERIDPGPAEKT